MREVQRSSDVRVDPPSDGIPVRSIAARGTPLAAWWSPQRIALALVAGLASAFTGDSVNAVRSRSRVRTASAGVVWRMTERLGLRFDFGPFVRF